ncbi:hypothetical protein BDQ17DRAFT_149893 [Cyathus striatus]|nr:hypothetical protein BDQ17DRAFT_149893 [Cyathus striatus]
MGQYWRVYNIDKRETIEFSFGTKLGEWFFTNDPTDILSIFRRTREHNWCEDRVICFGDYANTNDLPDGMITDDELRELGFEKETQQVQLPRKSGGDIVVRQRVVWEPDDVFHHLQQHFRAVRNIYTEATKEDYTPYVLRNVSKKLYVRGDGAKDSDGDTLLGYCLFSRICWSQDSSSSMRVPYNLPSITRGLWAGDRFDVVLHEDVNDVLESDGWKDVTKQMKREIASIFEENDRDL